ncbi:MAG: YedE-related selenium metabolism membrane protein [Chitinispirillaceae bacterium]|nr:YedE-related selenium metabolism membrane protein [Chitinispirillaceae bacterium]
MRCRVVYQDAAWAAGAGAVAGAGSALLTRLGNPIDGGISIACFCRDIAGSLGLHQIVEFSYLRPELAAIVLAAGATALVKKDFSPTGGSSTVVRFFLGILLSFGVFAFVGCPMRTGLRLAGGDPSAIAGLAGLIAGVGIGTVFLVKGFTLGKSAPTTKINGTVFHTVFVIFFLFLLTQPVFITLSNQRHAPLIASLAAGTLIGIAGQRSKLCFIGGFRNFFLIGDMTLLTGFFFLVFSALATNMVLGQAHFGVHIIGSADVLWSFLALCLVGMASTFLGGCPFRQLIMASQGNGDSAITVAGITAGAAIAYNCNFAFTAGSLDLSGKIAVVGGCAALVIIGFLNRER